MKKNLHVKQPTQVDIEIRVIGVWNTGVCGWTEARANGILQEKIMMTLAECESPM